ncbi:MAG: hypothetical protein AB8B53_07440 [Flavobacteriales bacterium]
MKNVILSLSCTMLVLIGSGCGEQPEKKPEVEKNSEKEVAPEAISAGGNVLKLNNQLFSIPSPIQTAILIRKQKLEFNSDLVSDLSQVDSYLSKNKQALNLGVLGSDLAYLSNYNDAKRSLSFLSDIEKLAEKLDIKANIDPSLIKRFNENIDIPDSLNVINADFYKNAERHLKDNMQNEISSLILVGGWVESLHFATHNASNEFLRSRIGEQKSTVGNVKSIMKNFKDDLGKEILAELEELERAFGKLNVNYEFVKPITDPSSKTTYIKSKSEVELSDSELERIKSSVTKIRTLIIS